GRGHVARLWRVPGHRRRPPVPAFADASLLHQQEEGHPMNATLLLTLAVLAQPPQYPDKANLLVLRDAEGRETRITKPEQWEARRKHILENMQLVMGPLPDAARKVDLDVQVIETKKLDKYERISLPSPAEKGDRVPGYLLTPNERKEKLRAVLCLHQTVPIGKDEPVGLGMRENMRYAQHLAERGYV